MPMYSRDRDILLAETIERILNKLEEDNQAALDEAGLFRRMQNTYRAASGRVGDFTSGRFKNNKDGRANLDKLKDISPKKYYYFLDNSGRFANSGYYAFDSFVRFPEGNRRGEHEIILPIPAGVNLEDVTAKSATGARYFEFRFQDLADKYSLNPKARVARMTTLYFNMLTQAWDVVNTQSITVDELLGYQQEIEKGTLADDLDMSRHMGLVDKTRGVGKQRGKLGAYSQDKTQKGKFYGIRVTDNEILQIPGMQDAFDEYSGRLSSAGGSDLHPNHSQADNSRDWQASKDFSDLAAKIKALGGKAFPRALYPKVAAEVLILTYGDIQTRNRVGSMLKPSVQPIDYQRIISYKDVINWLQTNFTAKPAVSEILEVLDSAPTYIPSTASFLSILSEALSKLRATLQSSDTSNDVRDMSATSNPSNANDELLSDINISATQSPESYWKISSNLKATEQKVEALRTGLVSEIQAASRRGDSPAQLDRWLKEMDVLSGVEISIRYIKDVMKGRGKVSFSPKQLTTIEKAAEWMRTFIIKSLNKYGEIPSRIALILDPVLSYIVQSAVLSEESRKALFNVVKDIQGKIMGARTSPTDVTVAAPEDLTPPADENTEEVELGELEDLLSGEEAADLSGLVATRDISSEREVSPVSGSRRGKSSTSRTSTSRTSTSRTTRGKK